MDREGRIWSNDYPHDWKYYTLTYPVASYAHLTWAELVEEVNQFNDRFYSYPQVFRRMLQLAWNARKSTAFLVALVANLSFRSNHLLDRLTHAGRDRSSVLGDAPRAPHALSAPGR
jgi:hypothetical protein